MVESYTPKTWLQAINKEIDNRDSYQSQPCQFIQLYFVLNNLTKYCNSISAEYDENKKYPDSEIIKEFLPRKINEDWVTSNDRIRTNDRIKLIASELALVMRGFVSFSIKNSRLTLSGIPKSQAVVFSKSETVLVRQGTSSMVRGTVTKADIEAYSRILKYSSFKKSQFSDLISATLEITYQIRNNYYHGRKGIDEEQNLTMHLVCYAMIYLLRIIDEIWDQKFDLSDELEEISRRLNDPIKAQIKITLGKIWNEENSDIGNWLSYIKPHSPLLNFSFYCIVLERITRVIDYSISSPSGRLIDSIRSMNKYWPIGDQSDFIHAIDTIKKAQAFRNDIFHGDKDNQLENSGIVKLNDQLNIVIGILRDWLSSI